MEPSIERRQTIEGLADIKLLVDTFYGKVRQDALLAPIFNERIGAHWPQHLEKLYKFWQTVLLKEHTYFGSPFTPHALLEIDHTHFRKWVGLFVETIDTLFVGERAEEAKWRAQKMAEMFEYKNAYYRKESEKRVGG
ncbi:hemoglobin [Dyadobacter jejuensis]|uniref:Hemoglobin n=1 Tax=Dyadobacter jejuensis TaxID=1082580 RepID=A0A316AT62_9BACT|nr:group III truncated hemoglobin [Dyadobacter jejuensis]PWJ60464.1 hemoglobin [Dyadobacter jejuensis]